MTNRAYAIKDYVDVFLENRYPSQISRVLIDYDKFFKEDNGMIIGYMHKSIWAELKDRIDLIKNMKTSSIFFNFRSN